MEITDIQKKVLAKAMTEISDLGIDFLGVEISKIDDYQVNFYYTVE